MRQKHFLFENNYLVYLVYELYKNMYFSNTPGIIYFYIFSKIIQFLVGTMIFKNVKTHYSF